MQSFIVAAHGVAALDSAVSLAKRKEDAEWSAHFPIFGGCLRCERRRRIITARPLEDKMTRPCKRVFSKAVTAVSSLRFAAAQRPQSRRCTDGCCSANSVQAFEAESIDIHPSFSWISETVEPRKLR